MLSSSPIDNNTGNNFYTITILPNNPPVANLSKQIILATKDIPVVIHQISPNPTDEDLTIQLNNFSEKEIELDFFNALGYTVTKQKVNFCLLVINF